MNNEKCKMLYVVCCMLFDVFLHFLCSLKTCTHRFPCHPPALLTVREIVTNHKVYTR